MSHPSKASRPLLVLAELILPSQETIARPSTIEQLVHDETRRKVSVLGKLIIRQNFTATFWKEKTSLYAAVREGRQKELKEDEIVGAYGNFSLAIETVSNWFVLASIYFV